MDSLPGAVMPRGSTTEKRPACTVLPVSSGNSPAFLKVSADGFGTSVASPGAISSQAWFGDPPVNPRQSIANSGLRRNISTSSIFMLHCGISPRAGYS